MVAIHAIRDECGSWTNGEGNGWANGNGHGSGGNNGWLPMP
jgi:hypothetical protein